MRSSSLGPAFKGFGTSSVGGVPHYDPIGVLRSLQPVDTTGLDTEVDSGFGNAFDKGRLALAGLGTIGNLWGAFQAQKLANRQFDFTKRTTEANMANQIQSYNTTLEDRARSRAAAEGQTSEQSQAYIDKNRLVGYGG